MEPDEFVARWNACPEVELVRYPREAIAGYGLSEAAIEFMSKVGLPSDAAPFLSFDSPRAGRLRTVAEYWGLDESFARWIQIGTNGSGDPIAIDVESPSGAIHYLNHDNEFRPRLMASSVDRLAHLLLYFRELVDGARELAGSDAFLQGRVPAHLAATFLRRLAETDPIAASDSMWLDEVTNSSS